jgi:hypothetical protein
MRNKIVTLAIAAGLLAGTSALAFAQYQPYYPYQPYYGYSYGQPGYGQWGYYDLRGQWVVPGGEGYRPGYSGGSMPPYGYYQPGYGGDTYYYAPPPRAYDIGRLPYYYGSNTYIPGWGYGY